MGDTKGGAFDIRRTSPGRCSRARTPTDAATRDVVRPWVNGLDMTRRPRDMWIIDFGTDMPIEEAALYEAPFEYVQGAREAAARRVARHASTSGGCTSGRASECVTALGGL